MIKGLLGTNKVVAYKHNKIIEKCENPLLQKKEPQNMKHQAKQPRSALFYGDKRQSNKKKHHMVQQSIRQSQIRLNKEEYLDRNLSLSDYLKLTSLTRRVSRSNESRRKNSLSKSEYMNQTKKKSSKIDNHQGISLIYQQTQHRLKQAQKQFHIIFNEINHSQEIGEDEDSLVFMCNVLNLLEDRMCESVKLAKQLIEEQKKKKNIEELKAYGENKIDPTKVKKKVMKTNNQGQDPQIFHSSAFIYK